MEWRARHVLHGLSRGTKRAIRSKLPGRVVITIEALWGKNPVRLARRCAALKEFDRVARMLDVDHDVVVLGGPFAGMSYVKAATGSAYWPKVIGSYESALHATVEQIATSRPSLVVDVGAAEGYYAVGFGRRIPTARIVASDIDQRARALCRELARLNAVDDRITITGQLDCDKLDSLLEVGCWIIMDVEGAELDLLDPEQAPKLKHVNILVELHDFVERRITETLCDRFVPSHTIEIILEIAPVVDDIAHKRLMVFSGIERDSLLSEERPEAMRWAVMRPMAAT